MAFYDFFCDECGQAYEAQQRMMEKHEYECPACKKPARRIYSATFHNVDFRYGWDVGMGQYVDTKKDRETFMREKGLRRIRD